MIRKLSIVISITIFLWANAWAQDGSVMYIGILAKRGKDICMKRWSATAQYLSNDIPEYQFEIIPLSFKEVEKAVTSRQIHFLFANSGIYTNLSSKYSLERIATGKRSLRGEPQVLFGGGGGGHFYPFRQ